jgi:hypothetical protein
VRSATAGDVRLFPFELRFLARSHTTRSGAVRRSPPDRWVINLAAEYLVLAEHSDGGS